MKILVFVLDKDICDRTEVMTKHVLTANSYVIHTSESAFIEYASS